MTHSGTRDNSIPIIFISQLLDSSIVGICSYLSFYVYSKDSNPPEYYKIAIIIIMLLVALIFPYFDIYQSWRGKSKISLLNRIILAWLTVFSIGLVASVALKINIIFSRIWMGLTFTTTLVSLFLLKLMLSKTLDFIRSRGKNNKKIAIYGYGNLGIKVFNELTEKKWLGYNVTCFFDDNTQKLKTEDQVDKTPVFCGTTLLNNIDKYDIKELWIALPLREEKKVRQLQFILRHKTTLIRFVPDIFSFYLLNQRMTDIGGIPILDLNGEPLSRANRVLKRIEDIVLSIIIITLISPIFVIVACLVKMTSKGPIFFRQLRHGWDGKPIKIYKFRSMYTHNESPGQVTQATKGDKRVTKIGKIIRSTSLDELPQFFNVIQGRMSIVGPRPHPIEHNEFYKDRVNFYMQRHKVKPGITGWAQINGLRGETDTLDKMKMRVEYDLYYIQNWSLLLDIKIIFLTAIKGMVGKNAY